MDDLKWLFIQIAKEVGWFIVGFVSMTVILWAIIGFIWIGFQLASLARF
jgi:hypothetical protein